MQCELRGSSVRCCMFRRAEQFSVALYKSEQTMRAGWLLALVLAVLAEEQDRIPAGSSPLAKFVLTFSRPGAFNKTHSVFGEELGQDVTSCPLGESGLACRQSEARRVQDDCPGGNCEACHLCKEPTEWPHCCQHNSLCCSELALACQSCNRTELHTFCNKHFKKCF